ncbi:MAG: peroxiredoxin family protein [bacterium]
MKATKPIRPEFQKVFAKFKENQEVVFIAVNTSQDGDSIEKVRDFVDNEHFTVPFAYDDGAKVSSMLEIKCYPTLFVIDKAGKLQFKHIGYSDSLEDYELLLSNYIAGLISNKTACSS